MFEANKIVHQNYDWVTFLFLLLLLLLAVVKLIYNERLLHANLQFFSKKYVNIYFNKEKYSITDVYQVSLFTVQLAVFSLLFYFGKSHLMGIENAINFKDFTLITTIVLIYFFSRHAAGKLIAFLFNLQGVHHKFMHFKISYLNNFALWMLPLLALYIYYFKLNFLVFKFLGGVAFVLLILRYALFVLNNKKLIVNNLFYFILYLCALEIAPLIIFLKLTI
jgi:hypothetical protein